MKARHYVVAALAATACVLLVGCASAEENTPPASSTPAGGANGSNLTVEPTFDPEQGLWLSDGWPVPAPDAEFDPDYRWSSATEIAAAVGACLQDDGWDVVVSGVEGGFEARVAPEQQDAYQGAMKSCHIELGIGTNPGRALDSRLAREEYAAQEQLRDCLANLGADAAVLPSYQVYEEALLSSGKAYNLYDQVPDRERYLDRCPNPLDTWGYHR